MKNILFGMALSTLLFAACNNTTKTTEGVSSADNTDKNLADTSATKSSATASVLNDYLKLKNALAEDNDANAAAAAKSLVVSFTNIDQAKLPSAQAKIFSEISADAKEHAEHIGTNAGNIKHQREHFETLSGEIYELLKAGTAMGTKIYYTNCPMYNKGKGGNWLSETKEIHNPYYGKSMPDCGSVKEELN
ncbi:DUF3347 domain-containing protein [Pedobacter fastidiosus]|uniref:DUF3347 domain-containing protein n=1 Tax=Pedobacter fastidiosus TaxID=2765361 RepID=A0ABR7KYA3_9SPHI|nr:DUF3347 domain-containing protein [Pedobacter fastidiosus]MBC6113100.1 DUF3347 domain-containing protein [Pedobacter fastidiosus]